MSTSTKIARITPRTISTQTHDGGLLFVVVAAPTVKIPVELHAVVVEPTVACTLQ
jgi:hypothetical protein